MLEAGRRFRRRRGAAMDAFPISSDLQGKSVSAYEHLRRAISRGQLRPGRRLSATGLATAFRISETPVREALLRLATEGFLAWEPSKGHFTKRVTLEEQVDLHDLIAINLGACLGPNLAPASLDAIAAEAMQIEELLEAAPPSEQTARLQTELGTALVALRGNQVLSRVMSIVFDRTWLIRRLDLDSPGRVAEARRRIVEVAAAVARGEGEAAHAVVEAQLLERRGRLATLVEAANLQAAAASYP